MLFNEIEMILKVLLSAFLMFILGRERLETKRFVGPRTLMFMGSATTMLTMIAIKLESLVVLGGVMTGIGFLGGGVITKEGNKVGGLTTASLMWMAAMIGIAVGLEFYYVSVFAAVFSFLILRSKDLLNRPVKLKLWQKWTNKLPSSEDIQK